MRLASPRNQVFRGERGLLTLVQALSDRNGIQPVKSLTEAIPKSLPNLE